MTILAESSRALAPLVDESIRGGFASAEEGISDLLSREGGCITVVEASKLFRKPKPVTRQAINEKIRAGQLIAYRTGGGSHVLPVWQFRKEGGVHPGLVEVLEALRKKMPSQGPFAPFTFFLQGHPVTNGETPLEALRKGKIEKVLAAVEADAGV